MVLTGTVLSWFRQGPVCGVKGLRRIDAIAGWYVQYSMQNESPEASSCFGPLCLSVRSREKRVHVMARTPCKRRRWGCKQARKDEP